MEMKRNKPKPRNGRDSPLHDKQPKGKRHPSIEEFRRKIESDSRLRKHVHYIDIKALLYGKTGTDAAETLAEAINNEFEDMKKDDEC